VWKHAVDGDVLIRTTQYSLPEYLHSHIELVQPTTYFSRSKAMSTTIHSLNVGVILPGLLNLNVSIGSSPPGNSGTPVLTDPHLGCNCSEVITVSCLLQLYNADWYTPIATGKNSIGITGYLGEFANMADLKSFYSLERPAAVNSTFNTVLVNGAYPNHIQSGSFTGTHGYDVICRWSEPPRYLIGRPRSRFGHTVRLWSHLPDARNVLLDWR
jgi:tripeptidyl-peptidase-1